LGENIEDAAVREVFEETNIKSSNFNLIFMVFLKSGCGEWCDSV
jgi:ADP-ribose pyrophosphatase YjhB (NUDIX family)